MVLSIIKTIGYSIISLIIVIVIFFILIIFALGWLWEKNFNRFDYESAKEAAIKYLNENQSSLEKIVVDLYEKKSSIKDPYNGIQYASYYNSKDFNFKFDTEYIEFELDSQGGLGGQNYGLIYSNDLSNDLIIYDESEQRKNGNNIFIRQKIKGNWYFYYDDWDGKVNIEKLKS